jgi:hypothetical protein
MSEVGRKCIRCALDQNEVAMVGLRRLKQAPSRHKVAELYPSWYKED